MNKPKHLLFLLAIVFLGLATSCNNDDGGDDGGNGDDPVGPSAGEEVIEALEGSTWTIDPESSAVANLDIDVSTIGITFLESSFTLSGDITPYARGGTFTVEDDGDITDVDVEIASDELQSVDGSESAEISAGYNEVTIMFDTEEAAARVGGLGGYELVFTSN